MSIQSRVTIKELELFTLSIQSRVTIKELELFTLSIQSRVTIKELELFTPSILEYSYWLFFSYEAGSLIYDTSKRSAELHHIAEHTPGLAAELSRFSPESLVNHRASS